MCWTVTTGLLRLDGLMFPRLPQRREATGKVAGEEQMAQEVRRNPNQKALFLLPFQSLELSTSLTC